MPQTANSFHIFFRRGGYEPSVGFHHVGGAAAIETAIDNITPTLQAMTPIGVSLVRWEWQNEKGFVLDEGPLAMNGTLGAPWASFKDCTYISWVSGGPKSRSGLYLHPRPATAYEDGVPNSFWVGLVGALAAQVVSNNCTDSEGVPITAMHSFLPSRRRRVRLAP